MDSLATNRDDGKGRGRTGLRPFGGMGSCRTPIDHHKSSARASLARTGRRIAVGRFYSDISQVREVMAREHTGLLPEVIRAVVEFIPERQVAAADPLHHVLQDTPDAAKVVHSPSSLSKSSFRPDHHGRSEKGWRHQISVMRLPK